jgi:hypothetical protein
VNGRRWINPSQPQTLYGATMLCYIDGAFGLLYGIGAFLLMAIAVGLLVGGFCIANEIRWGYWAAVAAAVAQVALLLTFYGLGVLRFPVILNFMFDGLLVALLVHPMSRDYQRLWFH